MGLNMGVRIKQQPEGYMQYGCNPKGTPDEIAARLYEHLVEKMGSDQFGVSVNLWDGWYTFDVRPTAYGSNLPGGMDDNFKLHREMLVWAWEQFSDDEGVEMKTYHVS